MNEYKREQKHWQREYNELNRKLTYHDDHLRTIDAWFSQLLDEVRVLAARCLADPTSECDFTIRKIKEAISDIFSRIPGASPEALNLQSQLASALSKEKTTIAECQSLASEKRAINGALETASYRYLKAEKAVERAKSLQVQKLERQAMLGAARTKVASLTDEDYADSALLKAFKSQHEDAERTQHRALVEEDNRTQTTETESMIARIEVDLARIRNSRDELTSELAIRKSADDEKRISFEQAKELTAAKDIRITALESEVERLKHQIGEAKASECNHDDLDADALKAKLSTLENQYNLLSQELPSMETAWKKTQALAAKKIAEVSSSEDVVLRLNAEKATGGAEVFCSDEGQRCQRGRTQGSEISECAI
ncbi:hypothetical protein L1887_63299 [Cichorium endivia]|nr:hypothetical protein L1887_63299 [Cichorium endivia]